MALAACGGTHLDADVEARFYLLQGRLVGDCERVVRTGQFTAEDRRAVDRDVARLAALARAHPDETFSKEFAGEPDTHMRDALLNTAYRLSCGDATVIADVEALAQSLPGDSQPNWPAADRATFARAKSDIAYRCGKPDTDDDDLTAVEQDVADLTTLSTAHPLVWDELGFKNTPPPGGWGEAGEPSLAPFIFECEVPGFWALISRETGVPIQIYTGKTYPAPG